VGWTELALDRDKAWDFCEGGNETLGSIKGGKFLDYLKNY
jgi:hypothetical protein